MNYFVPFSTFRVPKIPPAKFQDSSFIAFPWTFSLSNTVHLYLCSKIFMNPFQFTYPFVHSYSLLMKKPLACHFWKWTICKITKLWENTSTTLNGAKKHFLPEKKKTEMLKFKYPPCRLRPHTHHDFREQINFTPHKKGICINSIQSRSD